MEKSYPNMLLWQWRDGIAAELFHLSIFFPKLAVKKKTIQIPVLDLHQLVFGTEVLGCKNTAAAVALKFPWTLTFWSSVEQVGVIILSY